MTYLSFVPSAGGSISLSFITVILFLVLSGISLGLYFKDKIKKEKSFVLFKIKEDKTLMCRGGKTQVII